MISKKEELEKLKDQLRADEIAQFEASLIELDKTVIRMERRIVSMRDMAERIYQDGLAKAEQVIERLDKKIAFWEEQLNLLYAE